MEYGAFDNSVYFSGDGRSIAGARLQSRPRSKLDSDIHQVEQKAYAGVLRAFKVQSDDITWEKESLITELRRELKISDGEHRVLLNKVNEEEAVHRIRQLRHGGEMHSSLHRDHVISHNLGSLKRQKKSHSIHSRPMGPQSSMMHLHAVAGNKADAMVSQSIRCGSVYQALPNQVGWLASDGVMLGTGRRSGRFHLNEDYPSTNGGSLFNFNQIGVPNTSNLVKEVEWILSHPDMHEIEKAKKLLRDQEQSLLDAIARLDEESDGESDDVVLIKDLVER